MMVPCLSILAAVASNGVIGKNNRLPWYLPADLKHFKTLTMGHAIIMGRKTYDSIGRPLPGRTNIIVTNQTDYQAAGTAIVHSLDDALNIDISSEMPEDNERFIIGGETLYRQAIALSQRMYLTEIQREFDGDTYFPEFDQNEWHEISRERHFSDDDTGNNIGLEYHFVTLERKTDD